MKEVEKNRRLFLLLDKLIKDGDTDSIELLKTFVDNDTDAMKKSYDIMIKK